MIPVLPSKVLQPFGIAGQFSTRADEHGPAGHHAGVDFGSTALFKIDNRLVRSVMDGEVMLSEFNEATGEWIGVYNSDQNLFATYWYLGHRLVKKGQSVVAYEPIGRVGGMGTASVPHLHFQVNRGLSFDYAGHVDPSEAFRLWKRADARRRYRGMVREK
jgi:murein DD-endopeptidase MepM/ murein hydrolase activator NlpD